VDEDPGQQPSTLEIRHLRTEEHPAAAAVAARALRDDPPHVEAYGPDPLLRLSEVHSLFADMFDRHVSTPQFGALCGTCVVAVAGVMTPGHCVGTMMGPMAHDIRSKPAAPVGDPLRVWTFWASWAVHDLPDEHWHIGPVGVEPGFQGLGIGGKVMGALCDELDGHGRVGWLETSKERNVRFYQALGFEVVDRADDLGVPSWFMRRDPVLQ
jgi:ribosomal protein S18 acetylase RimI-like enzyme